MKQNNQPKRIVSTFLAALFAAGVLLTGCHTGDGMKKDAEDAGDAIKEGVEEIGDEIDDNT